MIPVARKLAPRGFNGKVFHKGRAWLRERGLKLSGPAPEGLELKPFWRVCLGDLYRAYGGVCAYLCIFIEKIVGWPTVDHFVPKMKAIEHAYRWSNFRLACLEMNRRKQDYEDVLDPFTVPEETFHINLFNGMISPNQALRTRDPMLYQKAVDTIARLGLDDEDCCRIRREYFTAYVQDPTPVRQADLQRRAPFVWREMARQGMV